MTNDTMTARRALNVLGGFLKEYPSKFLLLLVLLCAEAVLASVSVFSVIPLADFMLDPTLGKANAVTNYAVSILASLEVPVSFWVFGLVFAVSNLLKAILDILTRYAVLRIKYSVFKSMALRMLRVFLHAKWSFFAGREQGKLLNSFTKELNNLGETMGHLASQFSHLLQLAVYLAIPFFISQQVTLVAFGMALVFAIPFLALQRFGYRLGKENTRTANNLVSSISETLSSARLILSFAMQKNALRRNKDSIQSHISATLKSQTLVTAVGTLFQPFAIFGTIVAIGLALDDGVLLSEIAAVLWSFMRAVPVLSKILQTNINISNFLPSFQQINRFTLEAEEAEEISGDRQFETLSTAISLDKVAFSYVDREPTITNLSLKVKQGSITALVGSSGAGKSTIVDLLLGLQQPNKGIVSIDGYPLADFDIASYRSKIGYVPQEAQLFNMSIRDNLLWANEAADTDDLMAACEQANASEFVGKLPNGLDTIVGDRGTSLSGGQRQRITLARALVRKPKIIILDEATSSLDAKSVDLIRRALHSLKAQCTVVLISHQAETLKIADEIHLIENGNVLATGPFDALKTKYGSYFELKSDAPSKVER